MQGMCERIGGKKDRKHTQEYVHASCMRMHSLGAVAFVLGVHQYGRAQHHMRSLALRRLLDGTC